MSEPGEMHSRLRGNHEMRMKKPPRWTISFLRALERTGDVRASAEDAGIDHTTAYARRRTHEDFAADWERALKAYAERVAADQERELRSLDTLGTTDLGLKESGRERSSSGRRMTAGDLARRSCSS